MINGVPVVVLGTTDGRIEVRVIADGRRSGDFDLPAGARPVIRALGIGHEATVVSVDADGTVWATEASGGRSVASATKVDGDIVAIEAVPVAGRVIAALTGADNAITLIKTRLQATSWSGLRRMRRRSRSPPPTRNTG